MLVSVLARFDDLVAGTAVEFHDADDVWVARTSGEVRSVLAAVDRAAAEGKWSFGFVAYEAAPAFDAGFPVHDPPAGLPLAWFATARAPRSVPVLQRPAEGGHQLGPWRPRWSPAEHWSRVRAVRARIAAGDTGTAQGSVDS